MTLRLRRSVLYLPASNARAIEKARTLACDVVVLDLEDAVAPEAKLMARQAAVAAIGAGGFRAAQVVVRVNGLGTEWGRPDLAAMAATHPSAIVVPKVNRGQDVADVRHHIGDVPVWAMIESAKSLLRLEDIASSAGLEALVVGTNDLAREMGTQLRPGRAAFLGILTLTIAAARAFGLAVLDGVYNDLDDAAGFAAQCAQAVELGFDGKTLIHPKQIDPCNAAFTPSAADVSAAQQIVDAFALPDNQARGAIGLCGRMVERLHLEQARKTLALARAKQDQFAPLRT
ncbi:CoA ester lyase [Acidisphaera sp. L21]|uniref:HpcH/HpaI aldolase/citrate lyase family protein n=1 Tax=Acidisphaera sp. L21 TaxID=1641851 RepID=UPI00131D36C6|nr:CoA ester lyase [Acidisphaera sp. L21]